MQADIAAHAGWYSHAPTTQPMLDPFSDHRRRTVWGGAPGIIDLDSSGTPSPQEEPQAQARREKRRARHHSCACHHCGGQRCRGRGWDRQAPDRGRRLKRPWTELRKKERRSRARPAPMRRDVGAEVEHLQPPSGISNILTQCREIEEAVIVLDDEEAPELTPSVDNMTLQRLLEAREHLRGSRRVALMPQRQGLSLRRASQAVNVVLQLR
mmetsp:Transcript_85125/g.182421  ORF Transcript_85125/g.182421 Transcript_85125/m.182421 type:complete len:211 (+) Transcript_85125:66-698(+)